MHIKQITGLPENAEVVTTGAYFLFSEMKKVKADIIINNWTIERLRIQ